MAPNVDPVRFLCEIWDKQGLEGYVFLSYKDAQGGWHDVPLKWPKAKRGLKLPNGGRDVYFCPNFFTKPSRKKEFARPTRWLHADLDEVDPETIEPAPTTAWRTSRGRYQCLWGMWTKRVGLKSHTKLNQRLNYLVEADKGGWSITKVLRVPGTTSTKYGDHQKVELLWEGMQEYLPRTVLDYVRDVEVHAATNGDSSLVVPELPDVSVGSILKKYKGKLPKRAKELLSAKSAKVGERSERLWELECLLAGIEGMSLEDALCLVRASVWNKYSGQRREVRQLWAELHKAKNHVAQDQPFSDTDLKLQTFSAFIRTPVPTEKWTVEGIWSHDAHGLLAGEAKTFKSFISTDLAVSVASGTRFLGHFEVPETGPVIIIQEENTPAMMKDRLEKITHSRGLDGGVTFENGTLTVKETEELPIHLMNNQRFNLREEEHIAYLRQAVEKIRPKLVVLDPLYLMIPGVDENSAKEITPILAELLALKQEYGVGILIVHHYNKPRDEDGRSPGNRISGSGVFYRWFESAVYVSKGKGPGEVTLQSEHRGAPPAGRIQLEFDLGEMGERDYHVEVQVTKDDVGSARRALRDLVEASPGVTLTEASESLELSRDRLLRLCERMGYSVRKGKADGAPGRPSSRIYPKSK